MRVGILAASNVRIFCSPYVQLTITDYAWVVVFCLRRS